jgi:DNA polymerase IV
MVLSQVEHGVMRKIIHLDMDCFYAAVEMRERPELVGKPIAVGGGTPRGVVTTCNYEARQFGVRSAMPGFMARERCPQLIFVTPRFDLYRDASRQIRKIFNEYTPLVEPLSLDEAYLDVTSLSGDGRYAWDIAKEIRARIIEETGLTASAGIAPNKMLAKIASDWRKPNGQFAIPPEQVEPFMASLPVRKLWGIGPKSAQRFAELGILTCLDLQSVPLLEMVRRFGKSGEELYYLCRGIDDREVLPNRISKSLSNETTFSNHLTSLEECKASIVELASELMQELLREGKRRKVRKAFVKVKFVDFTKTTKECVCNEPTPALFENLIVGAFARKNLPIRLLGTGVRFEESQDDTQAELFDENEASRDLRVS